MFLWKAMENIDKKDLLYCDTDSIIIRNFERYRNDFKMGDELGEWREVFSNENVEIRGEKMYVSDSKVVMAGVRSKFRTKETFEKGYVRQPKIIGLMTGIKAKAEIGTFREEEMVIQSHGRDNILERRVVDL